MGEERFPVYRLIDGRVMSQAQRGDRWSLVDEAVVAQMFRMFDGMPLDAVGTSPATGHGSGQSQVRSQALEEECLSSG